MTPQEIHVDDAAPSFEIAEDARAALDFRIVHQERNLAEIGEGQVLEALDVRGLADVGDAETDIAGMGREPRHPILGHLERAGVGVGHDDFHAESGEPRRGGKTDAARRAGDDRDPAGAERGGGEACEAPSSLLVVDRLDPAIAPHQPHDGAERRLERGHHDIREQATGQIARRPPRRHNSVEGGRCDDDSPARFLSGDRAMLQIHNRFELGGRGPVSVLDDVGGLGDLFFGMVRHDLESKSRGPLADGRKFDEVGDQAPMRQLSADQAGERFGAHLHGDDRRRDRRRPPFPRRSTSRATKECSA